MILGAFDRRQFSHRGGSTAFDLDVTIIKEASIPPSSATHQQNRVGSESLAFRPFRLRPGASVHKRSGSL
jgi:hypothetical protein